jgi:hypothetical protein
MDSVNVQIVAISAALGQALRLAGEQDPLGISMVPSQRGSRSPEGKGSGYGMDEGRICGDSVAPLAVEAVAARARKWLKVAKRRNLKPVSFC